MKNFKLIKKRRRIILSRAPKSQTIKNWLLARGTALALFLLVFVAASVVKIHAAGNVTGWLWGGGVEQMPGGIDPDPENWDGTNTNVGWVSLTRLNCDSNGDSTTDKTNFINCPSGQTNVPDYGVNIPDADGAAVTGYGWSGGDNSGSGLGWIDFDPQNHCVKDANGTLDNLAASGKYEAKNCDTPNPPGGVPGIFRNGNKLVGWARIVEVAKATVINNSGGWDGWIHLNGSYGVDMSKMTGDQAIRIPEDAAPTGKMTFATAGADELGWIDFSRAKIKNCPAISCATKQACEGDITSCDATFCSQPLGTSGVSCALNGSWSSGKSWTCSNGCETKNCTIGGSGDGVILPKINGACGDWNGCNNTSGSRCASGTVANVNDAPYESSWDCEGQCNGADAHCTALGEKSCGWVETNPIR